MRPTKGEVADAAQFLRTEGWLKATDAGFQEGMLAGCQWTWFAAAETVSHGGETSGGVFGLAQGALSAFPALGVADAPIVHIATAPFWYGTNPLVDGTPRTMTMVARSRCLVARVPRHVLAGLLEAEPGRWRYVARHLTDILYQSQLVASDLLIRDSRRRCIAILLRAAGCRRSGTAPAVAELTQEELAAMANMSRQTIGPQLRELAEAGLVTVGYRSITLHDPAMLRGIIAA